MARRMRIRKGKGVGRGIRERAEATKAAGPVAVVGPFMGTMQAGPARPVRAHGLADEHQDRGLLYVEKQLWDDAIGEFEKSVQLSPDFSEGWNNLGLCFLYTNRVEEAIDALNMAVKHFPGWHVALANLGLAFQKGKQKDEAIKYYQQAVNKNKNQPQVWCSMGEVLESLARQDEALEAYRHSTTLAPKYDLGLLRLGMLLARRTELDEAEGVLQKALDQNPSYAEAAGVLGAISARNGRLDSARNFYEQAKSIRPDRVPATASRGLTVLDAWDDSIKSNHVELRDSYDDLPSIAECMFNAGLVFMHGENLSMARSSFQTAADEDSEWAEPRIWLGMIAALENDPDEARRQWLDAREMDPENAMLSEGIGLTFLVQGLSKDADENFEAARELGRDVDVVPESEDEDEDDSGEDIDEVDEELEEL